MKSVRQIHRRMIRDCATVEKKQPWLRRVFSRGLSTLAKRLFRLTLEAQTAKRNTNSLARSLDLGGGAPGNGYLSQANDWGGGVRLAFRGESRLWTPSKLSPEAASELLVTLAPENRETGMSHIYLIKFDISELKYQRGPDTVTKDKTAGNWCNTREKTLAPTLEHLHVSHSIKSGGELFCSSEPVWQSRDMAARLDIVVADV